MFDVALPVRRLLWLSGNGEVVSINAAEHTVDGNKLELMQYTTY